MIGPTGHRRLAVLMILWLALLLRRAVVMCHRLCGLSSQPELVLCEHAAAVRVEQPKQRIDVTRTHALVDRVQRAAQLVTTGEIEWLRGGLVSSLTPAPPACSLQLSCVS